MCVCRPSDSGGDDAYLMSKNKLTEIRNTVDKAMKDLASASTICSFCKAKNRTYKAEYNHSIIGTLSEGKAKKNTGKKDKKLVVYMVLSYVNLFCFILIIIFC